MDKTYKKITLSDDRYLEALKRIRNLIASGFEFKKDYSNEIGNKYTYCTWGLCSNCKESWPDAEDHLWPDQFIERGRVAPLYFEEYQICPFDMRNAKEVDLNGFFIHVGYFRIKE